MLLNILMQCVFVGTCYLLSIVISCGTFKTGLFSFYGWQDHLNFSSEQRTVIYGASDFEATPIFCAINCAQNRTCIMFYICSLSGHNMCVLSSLYDQNTNQNESMPCIAYKLKKDCDIDHVYNRHNNVCVKCSPYCEYKDCEDVKLIHGSTGLYSLSLGGSTVPVWCDMDTDNGGWIVIQRRINGSVDFYRGWDDYKMGFGDPSGEYWIGLQNLHEITSQGKFILRIDMEFSSQNYYARYSDFFIQSENSSFRLNFSAFLGGNAGDSLSLHNGRPFSTFDRDNDDGPRSLNCAIEFCGAWWYAGCHESNLNGLYQNTTYGKGINWKSITGHYQSLSYVEMKIKRS
ncbi:microfibril-associated glycoprotein 4-like [Crassostrea angulata]|uniref:microfibril-associated glycoprotein 4-like n=1 Tax=Magallana angulata TaxID=2784310 RepID=UPI0022B10073|nr:microfibril-associated glycoprotein 4-like [Crassostrea angulata]